MVDAAERFSGFAEEYDRARPRPPEELAELLPAWAGLPPGATVPTVVDVGAGTGLATALWAGRAERIVAVEPSADMRTVAARRYADAGLPVDLRDATAEDTGLPDGCADIVTASQALHWFDPARALPEIARILRPGGVFAAFDCDWPPCVDAEIGAAFVNFGRRVSAEEIRRGLRPPHADKDGHLARLEAGGRFRHVTEIALHRRETGDADRLLAVARSQGGAMALLNAGVTEDAIGLTHLREVAAARLPTPRPWWWTYRVRLAAV